MSVEKIWLKSYDKHVPETLTYSNDDVGTAMSKAMNRFPDRIAFHFMDYTMTYKELSELCQIFASFLQKNGLKKGDVVSINLANMPQYLIAVYGTYLAGGTVAGCSPLLSADEMAFQLNDSSAKFLVTMDIIYAKRMPQILDNLPKLEVIIPTNISEYMGFSSFKVFMGKLIKKIPKGKIKPWPGKKVISFQEVMTTPIDIKKVEIDPKKDLALIQYTGGTTGTPKGTEITHFNWIANMHQFDVWLNREVGTDVVLCAFPYFHIAGFFVGLFLTYISASSIIIANPRDTDHIIHEMIDKKITVFGNVPTLFLMVQRNPKSKEIPDEILDNITLYVSGAAPFPAEAVRDFERDFHSANKFVEVYGMTETAVLATVNPAFGKKKIGSVGIPLPDTEIKLVDVETGEQVELGKPGEILIKGPQVVRGYHNKPDATAVTFTEGWIHSGDVGVFDEEGYLRIVDRTKDMLSVSGFKVYSVHVEDVMTKHPDIQLMAIIGLPDKDRPGSEIVKAVIQLKEGIEATDKVKESIKKFAQENLAKYEVPKRWDFRDELPLTAIGKVLKRALREEK